MHTIILGVALKPRDPDKDLKSILISELLMDKPPLLSWHSNQHIASLISRLSLTLHMGAGSHPSSLQQQRCTSRICQPQAQCLYPSPWPGFFPVPPRATLLPTATLMALTDTRVSCCFILTLSLTRRAIRLVYCRQNQ